MHMPVCLYPDGAGKIPHCYCSFLVLVLPPEVVPDYRKFTTCFKTSNQKAIVNRKLEAVWFCDMSRSSIKSYKLRYVVTETNSKLGIR